MDGAQITLVTAAVGSVLAFLGTVANMVNVNFKEQRARLWTAEDKVALAKTTQDAMEKASADTLKLFKETQEILGAIQKAAQARLETILAGQEAIAKKVDENTEVSVTAFKEANGVNAKLEKLGVQLAADGQKVIIANANPIKVHQQ